MTHGTQTVEPSPTTVTDLVDRLATVPGPIRPGIAYRDVTTRL